MKTDSIQTGMQGKLVGRFLFSGLLLVAMACQVACTDNKEVNVKKLELEQLKTKEAQLRIEAEALSSEKSALTSKASDRVKIQKRQRVVEEDLKIMEDYVAELNNAIAHYEKEIEIWRKAHRSSLVGLKAPSMKTASGREFQNVTIRQVTDEELIFDSDGQEMRLQMSELADQVKTRLVYEESLKWAK